MISFKSGSYNKYNYLGWGDESIDVFNNNIIWDVIIINFFIYVNWLFLGLKYAFFDVDFDDK